MSPLTHWSNRGELSDLSAFEARYQYGKTLNKGVIKVMSKMGVSTVASYVGSQLFEPVGVSDDILGRYFPGFHSRLGGITLEHVARDVLRMHASAFDAESQRVEITNHGEYQWRRDGELHLFNPRTVQKLQHATREKRFDLFKQYSALVDEQSTGNLTLRSLAPLGPERSARCPLRRWRASRPSSSASAAAPCPTAQSPKRLTPPWRSP